MNDGKISPIPEPVTPSQHDFIIAFRSLSREEQKKVLEDILAKRTPSILDDEDEKQL